jgi:hypothetical protein
MARVTANFWLLTSRKDGPGRQRLRRRIRSRLGIALLFCRRGLAGPSGILFRDFARGRGGVCRRIRNRSGEGGGARCVLRSRCVRRGLWRGDLRAWIGERRRGAFLRVNCSCDLRVASDKTFYNGRDKTCPPEGGRYETRKNPFFKRDRGRCAIRVTLRRAQRAVPLRRQNEKSCKMPS